MVKPRVLIVGAGLAGSSCAYLLQKEGFEVTAVERLDVTKKSKLCAGLITPRAMRAFESVFGEFPVELIRSEFDSLRCIAASHVVDLRNTHMVSVERSELDSYALQRFLDEGGNLIDSFKLNDLDMSSKIATGHRRDEGSQEISFDLLIAADGALSSVRRMLLGSRPDSILSIEAIADNNGSPLTMEYDEGFFGYCWYAPAGDIAKIGCCAYGGSPDLQQQLEKFALSLDVEFSDRRGAFIPTGSDVLLEHNGVYFIGDAASLICPPSGEGIYYALLSAKLLSMALAEHISYRTLMRRHVNLIKRQYKTRGLFYNADFIDRGIKLAQSTPYGAERAVKFALNHFTGFR